MRSSKPTPRQELIGRLALVVLALGLAVPATVLVRIAFRLFRGTSDAAGDGAGGMILLLLFLAGIFLYLVSGAFLFMACLPTRDTRRGPPRGFILVSTVFDAFWSVVEAIFTGW